MDNDENNTITFDDLKQQEIKRLTSPLQSKLFKKYDIEGNEIKKDFRGNYIIEPKKGILTDDEILIYASESQAASKIRLKRGNGDFSDKITIHGNNLIVIEGLVALVTFYVVLFGFGIENNFTLKIIGIILILFLIIFPIYLLFIKDYKDPNYEERIPEVQNQTDMPSNKADISSDDARLKELKNLYEVKVKIAEELVEKRFEPPQLTYDKFMSAIAGCTDLFNNQYEIIETLIKTNVDDSIKIDTEIDHRIKILKSLIETIDNLTNELVINISQATSKDDDEIKNILEDMNQLIDSIKEYK